MNKRGLYIKGYNDEICINLKLNILQHYSRCLIATPRILFISCVIPIILYEVKNEIKLIKHFFSIADTKCSELKGTDLLLISYTNDRKIGSKATFHCFAPGQRSGESFAECLENGTWSNQTPNCRSESIDCFIIKFEPIM